MIINICIISIPLMLSFEKQIHFYKKLIAVTISIFLTGTVFICWDIIAVNNNDWSFNLEYVTGVMIFNLPAEEIMFFITVPFAILFTYECVSLYTINKIYDKHFYIVLICAFTFFAAGFLTIDKGYTSTVFLFIGTISSIIYFSNKIEFMSKQILITILISFIPFFIVNYLLTSLPVVIYNAESISGIRILTIPVEDIFYSIAMISCWLFTYITAKKLLNKSNI